MLMDIGVPQILFHLLGASHIDFVHHQCIFALVCDGIVHVVDDVIPCHHEFRNVVVSKPREVREPRDIVSDFECLIYAQVLNNQEHNLATFQDGVVANGFARQRVHPVFETCNSIMWCALHTLHG
jgi:hypothetical protein